LTREVQPLIQPKRDLYGILGVSRAASEQEIRSAFEKLASEFHASGKPRNIDDVEEIRGIATAYRVLSDAGKRRRYDQVGHQCIGDENNKLDSGGPDKLDDVLKRIKETSEHGIAGFYFEWLTDLLSS
jgi:molecular chaperone DnaJ